MSQGHIYKSSSILNIRIKDCVFDSSRLDLTYSAWSSINLIRLFGFQENPNRGAQQVFGAHETRKAYDLFLVNVEPIVNMKQELFPDTSLSEVMTFWPPLLPPDEAGFFYLFVFWGFLPSSWSSWFLEFFGVLVFLGCWLLPGLRLEFPHLFNFLVWLLEFLHFFVFF